MTDGDPPEGYAHFASGSLQGTVEAYTKVLQAALRHDPRVLTETTWRLAVRDDLTERGIKIDMRRVHLAFSRIFSTLNHYSGFNSGPAT